MLGNCQRFYQRVRLIQMLQIDILKVIIESPSPFRTFIDSQRAEKSKVS